MMLFGYRRATFSAEEHVILVEDMGPPPDERVAYDVMFVGENEDEIRSQFAKLGVSYRAPDYRYPPGRSEGMGHGR